MRLLKPAFSIISLIILLLGLSCSSLWASEESHATEEEGHQELISKGPHGGRLFKDSSIALELFIFEKAMPPHFRAFLYKNGAIISPEAVRLTVQLTRFNGKKEEITFNRIEDFLQSNQIIQEPHSFDVS
ncbi:TPA: cation transporter, partial [Legionella pneumophila]|nr:cation transporter [Legionella pneumophila]